MKKTLFNILILLGCAVIFVAGLALVLIIAPGVEFFDVKYIRAADSNYEKTMKFEGIEELSDIVVNGNVVPINIKYVQTENVKVTLQQNFVGFTRSQIDGTELIAIHQDNVLTITTHEYEKFVYGKNLNADYGLLVEIPVYYTGNLNISSNNSAVNFSGLNANTSDVSIATKNTITFDSQINFKNVSIKNIKKDILFGEKVVIDGFLNIESEKANVSIANPVSGNLTYTTRTGILSFVGCNADLTVQSNYGEVRGFGDKKPAVLGSAIVNCGGNVTLLSVGGTCEVNTKSGNINFGESDKPATQSTAKFSANSGNVNLMGIFGSELVYVTTKGGDVNIENVPNIDITTSRGKVNISAVSNLKLVGGSGKIVINRILDYANITSKNGGVELSSQNGGVISNVDVTTKRGKVVVYNPIGNKYNITSERGNVVFYGNKEISPELNITAKRSKVFATNISGITNISTNGEINLTLSALNGKVNVAGRDKKVNIILNGSFESYFDLNSTKKNIADAPGLTTKTNTYYNTSPEQDSKTIKVSTRWGQISVVSV